MVRAKNMPKNFIPYKKMVGGVTYVQGRREGELHQKNKPVQGIQLHEA